MLWQAAWVDRNGCCRSRVSSRFIGNAHHRTPKLVDEQFGIVQLQQVMLNLIVNGIQAINDVADGQRDLVITTEGAEDGVRVVVRDTGPGLGPETLERLFAPHTTAWPLDDGTDRFSEL